MSTKHKVFCLAPWVTSHVTADGARSFCCVTPKHYQYKTLAEWWNSIELRQLRLDMLAGRPPTDACATCINNTRATGMNTQINARNVELMDQVADYTDEDGYTTLTPVEIEVKHILCNLKCRHCYDRSSSSIRTGMKKSGFPIYPLSITYKNEIQHHSEVDDIEWIGENTKVLYWTGGEPFMSPLIIPALEKLSNRGLTNVKQVVITNAMLPNTNRMTQVLDLLAKFKSPTIILSLDGMGKAGEFGRTGWEETQYVKNINLIKSKLPKAYFMVNYVLHAVSITSLTETIEFCIEHDLKFQWQLINIEGTVHYLDYNLITKEAYVAEFERARKVLQANPAFRFDIDKAEKTLFKFYKPISLSAAHLKKLADDNTFRGQDGKYFELLEGKLNIEEGTLAAG